MIVVLPSNRSINLNHLAPLIEYGARFVIVDDSEGTIRIDHPQFEVYNWGHRRKMLGALDIGYPRRNGASRDFGFYVAWKNSDPDEIIVALDDDCEVYHADFFAQVNDTLSSRQRPVATCDGMHLNILDLYDGTSRQLFPRGFPYSARINYAGMQIRPAESRKVRFCLGLWQGFFDVNAIDKIKGPAFVHPGAKLIHPSVIIERDKLISVCSMNMQFRRELIPAVYQLPMHVEVMPNWVVDRYGDIWGGFILKALMDRNGDVMAAGEPMINHLKDGNYTRNIWQEHVCHLINDEFVDLLLEARSSLRPGSYLDMMNQLHETFSRHTEKSSAIFRPYLKHLCMAMAAWNASLA
ncbi:MAG TPA: hypothetical protein VL282_18820 [Tepidisphaeraceae bacterium]|jgi:hypothetical protein|nr:hypothetical protein [Tepidisphaeraceae bacterium]